MSTKPTPTPDPPSSLKAAVIALLMAFSLGSARELGRTLAEAVIAVLTSG